MTKSGYVHVEVLTTQSSKKEGSVCGDVVLYERTPSYTTMICADGIGSGMKAHVAATMTANRLMELLRRGFSLRQGFGRLADTMQQAKADDLPYAAFTAVRILNDGEATILSYEAPAPIFVGSRHASVLPQRRIALEKELVGESNCYVEPGDAIVVVSDGITQAGLGLSQRFGWGIEGAAAFINRCLVEGFPLLEIPRQVHRRSRILWEDVGGDDCTVALAACRLGEIVNILTGPPSDPKTDRASVNRFLNSDGLKVVCGGTTAQIVSRVLDREVKLDKGARSFLAPPKSRIEGIDLVTEGAVTLNQVFNVIGEDPSLYEEATGVTELCRLLQRADRVNFFVGAAQNPGHGDISFRQKGIMPRSKVVAMLGERLKADGKLVVFIPI